MPAHRFCTKIELFHCKTLDFITALKLWLHNISDFSSVYYGILAVLQESVWDVDELKRCLIDIRLNIQQTVTDQVIDKWQFRLRAWVAVHLI